MEWNLRKEIGNNYMFPSYPGGLENPSFDLNQWNGATSTSFDQCSSYNFVPTAFEDTGFDRSKSMDMSYNPVPTLSEDLALNESKLDTQGKGLCQLVVNGSGCEDPDSFCLEECIQGVPDCRVLGLDQVDENFMNSLSDEDMRAMLYTTEPSQHVVDPCNKPQPLEDILTNLFNDPMNNIFYQNGIAAKNGLDAFGISLLQEDLSINSSMMSQGSMALDSSTSMNPRGSITENSILVADVEKAKIFEATALRELEGALSRINGRTRICFRDACYRLANDSRLLLDESKNELLEFHFDPSFNPSSRAYKAEPVEKETNVLDRAIVNLMFNPPCTKPEETWAPHDFRTKRIKRV